MRDRFLALWRTGAQAVFALVVGWFAARGLHIPEQWSGVGEIALIGAGAGVWAYGTHWLQSLTGNTWYAVAGRFVGRVLVLGAGALPSYAQPAATPVPAHAVSSSTPAAPPAVTTPPASPAAPAPPASGK